MVSTRSTTRVDGPRGPSFSYTPDRLTLVWLAVSLPLVVWDTGYIFGRPHTMEGGFLHWPVWAPYKLYAEVDHVYGWRAFNDHDGFTAAQGFLNAVETALYLYYLAVVCGRGRGSSAASATARSAALAVVAGFTAAVMTFSKTVLYWLQEYFGDYSNIGHNSLSNLILLWIIPNGAWLVGSAWMIWSLGTAIVNGLAGTPPRSKRD